MTERILLSISLKVPDNEARSALEALRVKMGFGELFTGLVREELWELEFDEPRGEALARAEELVAKTNLFANPNKHRCEVHAAAEWALGDDLGADEASIVVADRGHPEGEGMLTALARVGAGGARTARRFIVWRIRVARDIPRDDHRVIPVIERVAVTTSRTTGLFCNPHSQTARVLLPWGEEKVLVA